MIYKIKVTDQVDNDIRNIYEYVAYELQPPKNAKSQLRGIEECIMSPYDTPERHRFYNSEPWESRGFYVAPVDNYCISYVVDSNDTTVYIVRVMYLGRDIDVQLNKHTKYEKQSKLEFVRLM